jgi:hypothetical protein
MQFIETVKDELVKYITSRSITGAAGCHLVLVAYNRESQMYDLESIWPKIQPQNKHAAAFVEKTLRTNAADDAKYIFSAGSTQEMLMRMAASLEAHRKLLTNAIGIHPSCAIEGARHPLDGSTLKDKLPNLRNEPVLRGYISTVNFAPDRQADALVALQKELLVSLPDAKTEITSDYIASHGAKLYPVSLLGCMRGFLVQFFQGAPDESAGKKIRASARFLSEFLTLQLLDYLHVMLSELQPDGRLNITTMEEVAKTLYPNDGAKSPNQYSISLPAESEFEIEGEFHGSTFLPLLEAHKMAHHRNMINRRIKQWASARRTGEKLRNFEDIHLVTHHIGTVFKLAPINSLETSTDPVLQELAVHLRHASSASRAITSVGKYAAMPHHFANSIQSELPTPERLRAALRAVVAYYLSGEPKRWRWEVDGDTDLLERNPFLPLFFDDGEDLSTVFTFGLGELITNIRKYPSRRDGNSLMQAYDELDDDEKVVRVDTRATPELLSVRVTFPLFDESGLPHSSTLERIRIMERRICESILGGRQGVETTHIGVIGRKNSVSIASQEWRLHTSILTEIRDNYARCQKVKGPVHR